MPEIQYGKAAWSKTLVEISAVFQKQVDIGEMTPEEYKETQIAAGRAMGALAGLGYGVVRPKIMDYVNN